MSCAKANSINIVRRIMGGERFNMSGWQFSFIDTCESHGEIELKTYIRQIICVLQPSGVNTDKSYGNDLVIDGRKFSGNAMYKPQRCLAAPRLDHFETNIENFVGAITTDQEKLVSKGIAFVRGRVTNGDDHC